MADTDLIDQFVNSLKKLPGNLVGGPVDIANLLMGAISGKGTAGLVADPVGGSKSINKQFGLDTESSGSLEDITTILGGLLGPGGAAKAMIVPAALVKGFKEYNVGVKAAKSVKTLDEAREVYQKTGVYGTVLDDVFRTVIPDTNAVLKDGVVVREAGMFSDRGPSVKLGIPWGTEAKLNDVLDHPELFAAIPELKDVKIGNEFGSWKGASYSPTSDTIRMGGSDNPTEFLSRLLHETEHAIQTRFDMTRGGNPEMFTDNQTLINKALTKVSDMKSKAWDRYKNTVDDAGIKSPYSAAAKDHMAGSIEQNQLDFLENTQDFLTLKSNTSFDRYKRLGGEAEARVVQTMFNSNNYTAFPPDLYDVKLKGLIDPNRNTNRIEDQPALAAILNHLFPGEMKAPTP